jgi:Zn-dependent membrane protease YugP
VLVDDGIVAPYQERDAAAVLDAAFLTYLAAAVSALMTLLYWILRASSSRR